MKIEFGVAEPANIFFIIDCVSNWDIHVRPRIKRLYEAQFTLFGLKKKDNEILREYIPLRKKYRWGKLDSVFYPAKTMSYAFRKAGKKLNSKELKILKKVINYFYENAKIMYEDHKKKLQIRKKNLKKEVKKHKISKLLNDVAEFYEVKNLPKKITCHLLLNICEGRSGGGATIESKEHVTLEPVYLGKEKKEHFLIDLRVMLHEILHLIEARMPPKRREWLKKERQSRKITGLDWNIIIEAIADTLLPGGVLAVKYKLADKPKMLSYKVIKKEKSKRDYFYILRHNLSLYIYKLTENQIKKGRTLFDEKYLDKVIKKFNELKKKLK